jgi:8-oxo-dGTP pyrophosphatase MutT (NUDIX family)
MESARWAVSVKGVLVWDDSVVLLHNDRGEWELPGGRLDENETPEQCVVREIAEELGVDARAERLLDTWVYEPLEEHKVLILTFGCSAARPLKLVHGDEHDAVRLVAIADLDRFVLPAGYRESVATWCAHRKHDGPP